MTITITNRCAHSSQLSGPPSDLSAIWNCVQYVVCRYKSCQHINGDLGLVVSRWMWPNPACLTKSVSTVLVSNPVSKCTNQPTSSWTVKRLVQVIITYCYLILERQLHLYGHVVLLRRSVVCPHTRPDYLVVINLEYMGHFSRSGDFVPYILCHLLPKKLHFHFWDQEKYFFYTQLAFMFKVNCA